MPGPPPDTITQSLSQLDAALQAAAVQHQQQTAAVALQATAAASAATAAAVEAVAKAGVPAALSAAAPPPVPNAAWQRAGSPEAAAASSWEHLGTY